jgi:hypothetical protein
MSSRVNLLGKEVKDRYFTCDTVVHNQLAPPPSERDITPQSHACTPSTYPHVSSHKKPTPRMCISRAKAQAKNTSVYLLYKYRSTNTDTRGRAITRITSLPSHLSTRLAPTAYITPHILPYRLRIIGLSAHHTLLAHQNQNTFYTVNTEGLACRSALHTSPKD